MCREPLLSYRGLNFENLKNSENSANWHFWATLANPGMPKGRDPKISLYHLISIVEVKKVYNFGQLKNEVVNNLSKAQQLALNSSVSSMFVATLVM